MTKSKRLDGKCKLIPLTKRMESDMRSFCRDKGIKSQAELVRNAIDKYIHADYKDETLKLQALKTVEHKLDSLRDMNEILFKYLRFMHINLLAYHPELDPEGADPKVVDAAFKSAMGRHEKVIDALQGSLNNEPNFFEMLLHRFYTEDSNGKN